MHFFCGCQRRRIEVFAVHPPEERHLGLLNHGALGIFLMAQQYHTKPKHNQTLTNYYKLLYIVFQKASLLTRVFGCTALTTEVVNLNLV